MGQCRDHTAARQAEEAEPFSRGGGESWRAGAVWASLGGPSSRFTSVAKPLGKETKTDRTGSPALAVAALYAKALGLSGEETLPKPAPQP